MTLKGRLVDTESSLEDNGRHHDAKEHFSIKAKIVVREESDNHGAKNADKDAAPGLRQPSDLEVADKTLDHTTKGNHEHNDEESTVGKFLGIWMVAVLVKNI